MDASLPSDAHSRVKSKRSYNIRGNASHYNAQLYGHFFPDVGTYDSVSVLRNYTKISRCIAS